MTCALDEIELGLIDEKTALPTGQRYSSGPRATTRAAWKVVKKHAEDKTDQQCREIIATWMKNGVLEERDYMDSDRREEVKGLFVIAAKRPGMEVANG
jgi:hypothetical protein